MLGLVVRITENEGTLAGVGFAWSRGTRPSSAINFETECHDAEAACAIRETTRYFTGDTHRFHRHSPVDAVVDSSKTIYTVTDKILPQLYNARLSGMSV